MRSLVVSRWALTVVAAVLATILVGMVGIAGTWHCSVPDPWDWYSHSRSQNATCNLSLTDTPGLVYVLCLDKEALPDRKDLYIEVKAIDLDPSWRSIFPEKLLADETAGEIVDLFASLSAVMVWVRAIDPHDPGGVIPLQEDDRAGNWSLTDFSLKDSFLSEWLARFFQSPNVAFVFLPSNTKVVEGNFVLHVYAKGGDTPTDYGYGNTGRVTFRCWRE